MTGRVGGTQWKRLSPEHARADDDDDDDDE